MYEISILIPTCDRKEYIIECLESCLRQQGIDKKNIEIIITDNSKDMSISEVLEDYIKRYPYIKYHKNERNIGMVPNRNKCLQKARGKYIIFLSDDDKFYDNNSLYALYSELHASQDIGAVGGMRYYINARGEFISEKPIKYKDPYNLSHQDFLKNNNALGFGGTLFRFDKDILFDEKVGLFADWDYHLSFTRKYTIRMIPQPVFIYRIHEVKNFKSRSIFTNARRQYIIYRKEGYSVATLIMILGVKTLSNIVWRMIMATKSQRILKAYLAISNRMLKIKDTASL